MTEEPIPPDVPDFLMKYINSIGELEALLLLRDRRDSGWTMASVAERLYISETDAFHLLEHLVEVNLVARDAKNPLQFRYHPDSDELDGLVTSTSAIYAKHLVPVTNLVHSKSRTRIQEFADAFRLKRKE